MANAENGSILLERVEEKRDPAPYADRMSLVETRHDLRYKLGPDGKPRSVTRTEAHRYDGRTETGKTFTRWRTVSIESVIRTSSGKHVIFSRSRKQQGQNRTHCTPIYAGVEWGDRKLREHADTLLGAPPAFEDLYPMAKQMGLQRIQYGHSDFLRCWLGAADAQTLTRNLFGKTRYRKDLVKAVAAADPLGVWMAWSMRGLVPVDWIIEMLRLRPRLEGDARHPQPARGNLRPHLRVLDRNSLRRLVRDADDPDVRRHLGDIVRMPAAQPVRVRSWRELHDHVARYLNQAHQARHISRYEERQLTDEQKAEIEAARVELEGVTDGGLEVVAARDADTLVEWGTSMHNCIAAYAGPMLRGEVRLLGIHNRKGLIANVEVADGVLRQLLGPHNQTLPAGRRADVEAFLGARGVMTIGPYWGDGR